MSGESSSFDLIIIGAGINGAAIAREAALRGVQVLLLDSRDIGSGTTAASTRLIHGGLRYLEYAELNLVYESLAERERLFRTAPHLVAPLEFNLPVYGYSRRPKWQIHLGMLLYDVLSLRKSTPGHSMLSRAEEMERLPGLSADGLEGAAVYFDGQVTYPERLVVELVKDAVDHGTRLMTHTKACEVLSEGGRVTGVRWRRAGGEEGLAHADCVVNAAGPWVDEVNAGLGARRLIGGTRGSHLIVERFDGGPDVAVYTEAQSDGRPFFIVPWNDLYLIGTTDERFDGDPADVGITDTELDYLVTETGRLFPGVDDLAGKVLYTCAGVRPLPYKRKGAEGAITRRHLIRHHRNVRGLYSIVGGKLTTHRALAVDVLRRIRRRKRSIPPESETRERMLPGGLAAAQRDELLRRVETVLGSMQAQRLWGIYGAGSEALLALIREDPSLASQVSDGCPTLVAELVHAIENEWAVSLIDIFQRRSMTGLNAEFGLESTTAAADWLVKLGVWLPDRAASEVAAYEAYASRFRARTGTGRSDD